MSKANISFQISGLPSAPFEHYFSMDDEALKRQGAMMVIADDDTAPCRVSLAHAAIGEALLLVSYQHQPAKSPYRATGPIYVRKNATEAKLAPNQVPAQIRSRLLSVRAYVAATTENDDCIIDAEVVDGSEVESIIHTFFANEAVAYIHLHFARRGCYAARVDRAA